MAGWHRPEGATGPHAVWLYLGARNPDAFEAKSPRGTGLESLRARPPPEVEPSYMEPLRIACSLDQFLMRL